jgi:hypothetical protein
VEAGDEILAPVLHPRHRRLEHAREPGHDHEFRRQRHFLPEAAANVGRDHPQIRFRHSDEIRDDGPHHMRRLRRAGKRDALAGGVPCRMRRARLHRQRVLPVRADIDFDPPLRGRHLRVEPGRLHASFNHHVAGGFGVDEGCAAGERRVGAHRRRQFFDFDLDEIGDVLGLFPPRGHHRRDRLADKPHDVARQHRLADRHIVELVQQGLDRLHRCELGGGDDCRALGRHDPLDPTGGHRAPDEPDPSCRRQVAREPAAAGHQRRILEAPDRTADPTAIVLGIAGHSVPRFA